MLSICRRCARTLATVWVVGVGLYASPSSASFLIDDLVTGGVVRPLLQFDINTGDASFTQSITFGQFRTPGEVNFIGGAGQLMPFGFALQNYGDPLDAIFGSGLAPVAEPSGGSPLLTFFLDPNKVTYEYQTILDGRLQNGALVAMPVDLLVGFPTPLADQLNPDPAGGSNNIVSVSIQRHVPEPQSSSLLGAAFAILAGVTAYSRSRHQRQG